VRNLVKRNNFREQGTDGRIFVFNVLVDTLSVAELV
jgi:hypothetical protein